MSNLCAGQTYKSSINTSNRHHLQLHIPRSNKYSSQRISTLPSLPLLSKPKLSIMRFTITICLIALIVAVNMLSVSEAAYRKPPFNGSIFGKRNSVEYDNAKAITAMCEIALEACQSWFPQGESK